MAGILTNSKNRAKQKLLAGRPIAVLDPGYPDPSLVEYIGRYGVDAVCIDTERQSSDFQTVENIRRAADVSGITTIVQTTTDEPWLVTRYINRGIGGVQIPHIDTAPQARRAVASVQHALTHGGVVSGRAENFLTIAVIESVEAVSNLAQLLAVDGIDVFFVDPNDLSNALGGQAQRDGLRSPQVVRIVDEALSAILGAGKVAGTMVALSDTTALRKRGVLFLYQHLNELIAGRLAQYREEASG